MSSRFVSSCSTRFCRIEPYPIQIDPTYVPAEVETKQVYGVHLRQRRNNAKIDAKLFENVVTQNKEVCQSSAAIWPNLNLLLAP